MNRFIFTSYYANPAKAKNNKYSISNITPKWFDVDGIIDELFPDKNNVFDYKKGTMTTSAFINEYMIKLSNLSDDLMKNLYGKVLYCYEKPSDFCHRTLFREYALLRKELCIEIPNKRTPSIGVVGSRDFTDEKTAFEILDDLAAVFDFKIVSGGAKGADSIGERYGIKNKKETTIHLPDWAKHGKPAAFIRNKNIVDDSDMIVAFWDGESKGTKNTIDIAYRQNKQVIIYDFIEKKLYIHTPKKYFYKIE